MQKENKSAYEKFDDYLLLRLRENALDTDFDIRDWVLKHRYAQWNVGYTKNNLNNAYGANLRLLFPNIISFQEMGEKNSGYHLLMGAVNREAVNSHKGSVGLLQKLELGDQLLFCEQGFLASSHSWSECLNNGHSSAACLGYVYDDISHYFMADFPNRLIGRLNSSHCLNEEELSRARDVMRSIVDSKVSKYNSQPIYRPNFAEGYESRVLVCDQAFADASTIFGRLSEDHFEQMLLAAIRENPNSQILVKTHPDTYWEKDKRIGYFNHLKDIGRVHILREPINPYSLFECVQKVYVGSSQMGFEALLAGKQVVVFGAPFYAGWGLTDDRYTIPHRKRARSLEELFYYFYIWYTVYHVPGFDSPSRVEDAIEYIVKNRPKLEQECLEPVSDSPKVSIILPVFGVEKYLDECLLSIRSQTLRDIEIITVNDCSPDASQAIIDRHAAEDSRIRAIVLKNNVGQGFARNIGINAARGDYIQFLDSDDFLAQPDHLERVWKTALSDGADMVRGRKLFEQLENEKGEKIGLRRDWCEEYFEHPFHARTLAEQPEIIQGRHFCNWLYRRNFLIENDIQFVTTQWEEKPFLLKSLLRASSISSTDSECFVYRIRPNSTARRGKNLGDCHNQFRNFEMLVELLESEGAFKESSPIHGIATHLVTQFLHFMVLGFVRETHRKYEGVAGEEKFFDKLSALLLRTGLTAAQLSSAPRNLSFKHKSNNAYGLIFAGLIAGRYDLVRVASDLSAVDQNDLMKELMRHPETDAQHQLQVALGMYARNDLVRPTHCAPLEFETKPRLLIHIGSTKTGSTFIQHFLEHNRAALLRRGVYVPEKGLFWQKTRPHKQAGHAHFTASAKAQDSTYKKYVDSALALAEGKIHTVILSSEAFFLNKNSIEIARQFSNYNVQMLCYFRRQDEWANSQYAEFVAGGAVGRVAMSIQDWLREPVTRARLDYHGTVGLWESVVGRENIRLGVYDRKTLVNGDIIADFLTLAGLVDCLDLPKPAAEHANIFPFGTGHVKLIRTLNAFEWADQESYFNFIEDAGYRVGEVRKRLNVPKPTINLLSVGERRALLERYTLSNAMLASEYFPSGLPTLFSPVEETLKDYSDLVHPDEVEAIMRSFKMQSNFGGHKKEQAVPTSRNINKIVIPIEKTFIAYLFRLTSFHLNSRKLRKMKNSPDLFFQDMKGWWGKAIRMAISFERRVRSIRKRGEKYGQVEVKQAFTK